MPSVACRRWSALVGIWLALVAATDARLSHGRFENVVLYRPTGAVRQVVLFLSGDDGWNADADRMAKALTAEGALVVGLATPPLLQSFSSEGGECVYPDGDLENLSHWIQGYAHLPTYFAPLLVGYGSGAGLAYAALAQAPAGTFGGGLSIAFCPHLAMDVPPCDDHAAPHAARPARRSRGHGIDLAGEEIGILAVHGGLGDGLNFGFDAVQFHAHEFGILARPVVVLEALLLHGDGILQGAQDALVPAGLRGALLGGVEPRLDIANVGALEEPRHGLLRNEEPEKYPEQTVERRGVTTHVADQPVQRRSPGLPAGQGKAHKRASS